MAAVKPRPLTKFDYWQLPVTGPRYQLIDEDLYMAPAPRLFQTGFNLQQDRLEIASPPLAAVV